MDADDSQLLLFLSLVWNTGGRMNLDVYPSEAQPRQCWNWQYFFQWSHLLYITSWSSVVSPTKTPRSLGDQLSFPGNIPTTTTSRGFVSSSPKRQCRTCFRLTGTYTTVTHSWVVWLEFPSDLCSNAISQLVFNLPKFSNATLLLTLHWLLVTAQIQFKTLALTCCIVNGSGPSDMQCTLKVSWVEWWEFQVLGSLHSTQYHSMLNLGFTPLHYSLTMRQTQLLWTESLLFSGSTTWKKLPEQQNFCISSMEHYCF